MNRIIIFCSRCGGESVDCDICLSCQIKRELDLIRCYEVENV